MHYTIGYTAFSKAWQKTLPLSLQGCSLSFFSSSFYIQAKSERAFLPSFLLTKSFASLPRMLGNNHPLTVQWWLASYQDTPVAALKVFLHAVLSPLR